MADQIRKIYYFASTHWDREWYRPFQEFRLMLVERIDEIIQVLEEDPEFSLFTFDGQTILLDDYCEIRPENRQRLTNLIQSGRIIIGPWYTMPDELLVSGESLIRNLFIGHQLADAYGGKPMKVGFLCDVFGHAAQVPQILAGFGIHAALVGRGTNQADFPAYFIWQAPDGTGCLTFKVPESTGYASFWADVYLPHSGNPQAMLDAAVHYVEQETRRSAVPYVVLMDGMDHERIHRQAPGLAAKLADLYHCPVEFASLEQVAADVATYASTHPEDLPVRPGELIWTAQATTNHHMLIPHTLSSRYDIKLANDQCQSLYEKWVLPLMAFLSATQPEKPIPAAFWQEGYRQITENHAHDSICGCSIDAVHQDMHYRFRQARAIGSRLVNDSLLRLARPAAQTAADPSRMLTVFNPLPFARKETLVVNLDFPADYPHRFAEYKRFEARNTFRLVDASGAEVPYQLLHVHRNRFARDVQERYSTAADIHQIALVADLPAMGTAEYQILPVAGPVRYMTGMATSDHGCENAFLALEISDQGTLSILDKRNGRTWSNLIDYRDCGEIGDGWHHVPPIDDRIVTSRGSACSIELADDGPARCTFTVKRVLRLPAGLDTSAGQIQRSSTEKDVLITTQISLGIESRFVDIETTVDNVVCNHRLQLVLPTGLPDPHFEADQAFCFVRRKTGLDRTTGDWYEHDVLERPFESIVCKRDETRTGLAFLSGGGLHECSALEDAQGTILITLLRSFAKTHLTDGEPDGQLQGQQLYRYRLMPLGPDDHYDDLLKVRDTLQAGQRAMTRPSRSGEQASSQPGWLEVTGRDLAVTMIKPAEKGSGTIVRIVNYGSQVQEARLTTLQQMSSLSRSDMLEERTDALPFSGCQAIVPIRPYGIETLRLTFEPQAPDG